MSVPWRKEWRMRESSRPTRRGSRGLARKAYYDACLEHGDEHPATRAALGRLAAYRDNPPDFAPFSLEDVAYRRELGLHGVLNRSRRREFARRLAMLAAPPGVLGSNPKENRKRDHDDGVSFDRGPA